jgi:hypothetical protein
MEVTEQNLGQFLSLWQTNAPLEFISTLASELNVRPISLQALGIGWAPNIEYKGAHHPDGQWTFPERDAAGKVIGISCRATDGSKWALGKRGLVYPLAKSFDPYRDMAMEGGKWARISDIGIACPVCGKRDGCRVSADDPVKPHAVMCCRKSQGAVRKYSQEFLHFLRDKPVIPSFPLLLRNSDDPILVVEGATDAAAAIDLGFVGVGKPSASGGLEFLKVLLKGHNVVVVGENDESGAGKAGLQATAQALKKCKSVTAIMPPAAVKDLREWVQSGTVAHDSFLTFVEGHRRTVVTPEQMAKRAAGKGLPILLLEAGCTVFQSQEEYYISVLPEGKKHREVYPLYSHEFESFLQTFAVKTLDAVLKRDEVHETLVRLRVCDAPKLSTFIRIGHTPDAVWLDLADTDRRVVRITAAGWAVIPASECPLYFIRPSNSFPLPMPSPLTAESQGAFTRFMELLGPHSPTHGVMIASWLLGLFMPVGVAPILAIVGESGSGKSWASRAIKSLIDPIGTIGADYTAEDRLLSLPPKNEYDLFREASGACILGYDNLSYISPAVSDAICALVTGATFKTRRLYTVGETVTLGRRCFMLLNGIPSEMFERGDLRSRVRIVRPGSFETRQRISSREFWSAYLGLWPDVVGQLCTAVSKCLANIPACGTLDHAGRMQDFYQWANGGLAALGFDPALLARRTEEESHEIMDEAVGTSQLIGALEALLGATNLPWEGDMSLLFSQFCTNGMGKGFHNPKALSAAFKRESRELQRAGWVVKSTIGAGQNGRMRIHKQRGDHGR